MANRNDAQARPASPGERRKQAMMEAAYSLFTENGYASVTLDDIIKISGGSKSSLYSFFGSKEGLLKAVVEALAHEMLEELHVPVPLGQNPCAALRKIGNRIARLALSDNAINQFRLAVSNARSRPDLARFWYEHGPNTTFDGLAGYLAKEAEAGRLNIEDPRRAAVFFLSMIICKDTLTMAVGMQPPSASEIEELVEDAVEVFLGAYGREPS
ncbi:MAG: TetR/AcrR family transcriptional regulator [Deferrisomatales bacterium]|nr:TetR/AcrR family transcriptional regulator [Deferrisomatales bacterium]